MGRQHTTVAHQARRVIHLLFHDEGCFDRINAARCCWAPPQVRPQTSRQVVREALYACAAVCPHDGTPARVVRPWSDSETMSICVAHTARVYPHHLCVMPLEQAGWHRTANPRIPPFIRSRWLPPYSPELDRLNIFGNILRNIGPAPLPFF